MTYTIYAKHGDVNVMQKADGVKQLNKWLVIYRRNGWQVLDINNSVRNPYMVR